MSAAVTSFCRSTNCLLLRSGRADGSCQSRRAGVSAGSSNAGSSGSSAVKPGRLGRRDAGARALLEAGGEREGAVAGAGRALGLDRRAGQEDAARRVVAGRARDCDCRWMVGLQPPETQTRSQTMRPRAPSTPSPARDERRTSTALTRRCPLVRGDRVACQHLDAGGPGAARASAPVGARAQIDDRDRRAGRVQVERGARRRCRCWSAPPPGGRRARHSG